VKRRFAFSGLIVTMAFIIVLFANGISLSAEETAIPEVPVKGKVTMVDIGAKECIPCKMMAPIMEELEKEYHESGRAAIIFIDVWKNRDQGKKFGIRAIPTQIFYDKDGKEVQRHEGFMDKESIVAVLKELGVK
jgi:thioredoxin 1